MQSKQCSKCKETKKLDAFNMARTNRFKFGRTPWCKDCAKAYTRSYTEKHKEERRQYNLKYKQKNREALSEYNRRYLKKYYAENKETLIPKMTAYTSKRTREDVGFRIARNLRRRLHHVMVETRKHSSTLKLLGCSIDEFKRHLEKKFKPGMTWKNYGPVWHLDHIKPLSLFNLKVKSELEKAAHFKNLQPLFSTENQQKGNRHTKG